MAKRPSNFETARIELMLTNALGRDLTPKERKYLGLSAIAVPIEGNESVKEPSDLDERKNRPDSD